MGLLDDLLSQMTGGEGAAPPRTRSRDAVPAGGPSSGGMSSLMAALLPVVLSMLSNRGTTTAPPGRASAGGGLGDILGQVLGGSGSGSGAGGLGGLGALLEQFQRAGFGEQVGSWVGAGSNQPLTPDALERVFGHDALSEIARRAGVSEQDASRGLAELLPEVVDRVTPEGQMPADDKLVSSVDALTRRLGLG